MHTHHDHAYAFITAVALWFTAKFSTALFIIMHLHVPPVINELAQFFCYIGGGLAGFISAYLFWDKRVKPYLKQKYGK